MSRFDEWKVLVTGASRGIGAACATALLSEGAQVALVGRDANALASVAGGSEKAVTLAADLTDAERRDGVVDRAVEVLGGLDGMVLAAGVAMHTPFEALSEEALRRQLDLNLVAPLMLVRQALPALRSGRGSVVLLGSTLADRPARATTAYAASKAGLHNATRQLAAELAPAVRVNAVSPGVVDTAMTRALRLAPGEPMPQGPELEERVNAQLEQLRALHPLGRLGTSEEIAEAALHLLGAEWTTGAILTVDGGLTAG
jgi:3-oxoacyl-[acyl-carrier protein] reductase